MEILWRYTDTEFAKMAYILQIAPDKKRIKKVVSWKSIIFFLVNPYYEDCTKPLILFIETTLLKTGGCD